MSGHFRGCVTPSNCWCELKRYGLVFLFAIAIFAFEVIGGIIILITDWVWVDPLISAIIAIIMARWTWGLINKLRTGGTDIDNCLHDHH